MGSIQPFDAAQLDGAGLNRQAVFDLAALPADVAAQVSAGCGAGHAYRQLILLGHAGRALWEAVMAAGVDSQDPVDDFTVRTVERWMATCCPDNCYKIIYPGHPSTQPIGLQRLGELAGWHHATPFLLGIDREWGTWYAYRAVIVADTGFAPTRAHAGESACESCPQRVCVASCPVTAIGRAAFDFDRCLAYRHEPGSRCAATCLARVSCPVGSAHRYCDEQMRHSYAISLRASGR